MIQYTEEQFQTRRAVRDISTVDITALRDKIRRVLGTTDDHVYVEYQHLIFRHPNGRLKMWTMEFLDWIIKSETIYPQQMQEILGYKLFYMF